MPRRAWIFLLLLGSLWGASYLFIKVSLEDLSPEMIAFTRVALAVLAVAPFALASGALRGLRDRILPLALLGLVQIAGPFVLIAAGEQEISSSLAGILVSAAPIFTALLAIRFDHQERAGGMSMVGIVVGLAGVAVLLGVDVGGEGAALLGAVMVLVATLGYAIGGLYMKRSLAGVEPIGAVFGALAASAVLALPAALLSAPDHLPDGETVASMLALGIGGTGLAFVIFYRLIAEVGPARALLVTYIAPAFAVVYGVALLGESVGVSTFLGLALILGGAWLAAEGRLPLRPRSTRSIVKGGPMSPSMVIRHAEERDAAGLARLAARDSAPVPSGALLVAEVDGELWAALPLAGGVAVADPFHPTTDLLEMLVLRAAQLRGMNGRRPGRGRPRVRRHREDRIPAFATVAARDRASH
jgi:drug/metabolite transporter (DMT)-like permease